MPYPKCPNCRERMSFAEAGLCGVWSCLYCEGVWLPAQEVATLANRSGVNLQAVDWPTQGAIADEEAKNLLCPTCANFSFVTIQAAGGTVYSCSSCHGLFLPKSAVEQLSPRIEAVPWLTVESFKNPGIPEYAVMEVVANVAALVLLALAS